MRSVVWAYIHCPTRLGKFVIILYNIDALQNEESDQQQLIKTPVNLRAIRHRTAHIQHVLHQPRNSILLIRTLASQWRRRIQRKTWHCSSSPSSDIIVCVFLPVFVIIIARVKCRDFRSFLLTIACCKLGLEFEKKTSMIFPSSLPPPSLFQMLFLVTYDTTGWMDCNNNLPSSIKNRSNRFN